MRPGASGDRAGLAALALAEGAPLPSAVGWADTGEACPCCRGRLEFITPNGVSTDHCPRCGFERRVRGRTKADCERGVVLPSHADDEPVAAFLPRPCEECGALFTPTNSQQRACPGACRKARRARQMRERAERRAARTLAETRYCECGCGARVAAHDARTIYASKSCSNLDRARKRRLPDAGEAA